MRYSRTGGIRFLQIGRLQLSFCICSPVVRHAPRFVPPYTSDYRERAVERVALERSDSFVWPEHGV
jgi:hypothetical protein